MFPGSLLGARPTLGPGTRNPRDRQRFCDFRPGPSTTVICRADILQSCSTNMPLFIPPELIGLIIAHAAFQDDAPKTLATFALVSHTWKAFAQPLRFESLQLLLSWDRIPSTYQSVECNVLS